MRSWSFVILCTLCVAGVRISGASAEELEEQPASVSCGSTNRGALSDAAMLPTSGPGYVMAEPWRSRGTRYGTRELVDLVTRSSAAVAALYDGSQLSVADMSHEKGGSIKSHRSHQNGRDVDLIYYAMDADAQPFYPDSHMAYYTSDGQANFARSPRRVDDIPIRYFDLRRNWALVRFMMLDEKSVVEHIFVSRRVRRWLLAYAEKIKENPAIMKRASKVLHAPREVRGHNDHMHVRVKCSAEDDASGQCRGPSARRPSSGLRWYRDMACPAPAPSPTLPKRNRKKKKRPTLPPLPTTLSSLSAD